MILLKHIRSKQQYFKKTIQKNKLRTSYIHITGMHFIFPYQTAEAILLTPDKRIQHVCGLTEIISHIQQDFGRSSVYLIQHRAQAEDEESGQTEEQIPARYPEQNQREPVPPAAPHAHVAARVFMRGGVSESHFSER